ncbi:immunity protein YezG family protein [Nocardiopsis sp. CA-288880]|uniref:immunity protein YezG family protein n=1 Tax=Nocardiopsis sp. CA-288880 TaxID=3239995 RepID=UPI003D962A2D
MSSEGTQEHLQKIGTVLFGAAPEGWTSIEARLSAVGHVGQCLVYASPGGRGETRITTPAKISGHFMRLRGLMYHEGKGTWYTATFTLENNGSFNVDYDYDNEPDFLPPEPGPHEYRLDHQCFPRDEEHIPEWLLRKLREAGQDRETP